MPVNGVMLLAHRGGMITSPENTLESIRRARAEGADGIELDVRLTSDGEPVVFHDADTARATGRKGLVSETTWLELRGLRAFGAHRIPHLDDALAALADWPGAQVSLDFHEESLRLAEVVARRVSASPLKNRIAVLDFYWRRATLIRAREVDPGIRLAVMPGLPWSVDETVARLSPVEVFLGWDSNLHRVLYQWACRFYDIRPSIERAKAAGIRVAGGVANTADDILYCLGQGMDGIWTDDLILARRVLEGVRP